MSIDLPESLEREKPGSVSTVFQEFLYPIEQAAIADIVLTNGDVIYVVNCLVNNVDK